MNLLIVHNHYRPGGVRRVIELAFPALLEAWETPVTRIVLVGGEPPDGAWLREFKARTGPARVVCATEPAAGYVSEQRLAPATIVRKLRRHLEAVLNSLAPGPCVIWAHNQCLGRNLLLTQAVLTAGPARGFPVVMHHHDWWFDNRWARWPEMLRCGFRTLHDVARTLFPDVPGVRHAAINQADASVLQRHLGADAAWIPNSVEPFPEVTPERRRRVRAWIRKNIAGGDPVWLVPCRLIRRKNLAEALLLTRWLRPEAWLVTTGAVSSPAEEDYARRLREAAQEEGWRLRLSVLTGPGTRPSVPELMASSEAVLLTSLQEGFGLPFIEASAAGRPLIARSLPNISPDLKAFGFRLPQIYDEVWVDPQLLDWDAERRRQLRLFRHWLAAMPASCRSRVPCPAMLATAAPPSAVALSRLTLTAQLEVLRQPRERSWTLCARWNPWLEVWRRRAGRGALQAARWPRGARHWLSESAYAGRLASLVATAATSPQHDRGPDCQQDLLNAKLSPENLYPLLWSSRS